jgi:hypothetical protein
MALGNNGVLSATYRGAWFIGMALASLVACARIAATSKLGGGSASTIAPWRIARRVYQYQRRAAGDGGVSAAA